MDARKARVLGQDLAIFSRRLIPLFLGFQRFGAEFIYLDGSRRRDEQFLRRPRRKVGIGMDLQVEDLGVVREVVLKHLKKSRYGILLVERQSAPQPVRLTRPLQL